MDGVDISMKYTSLVEICTLLKYIDSEELSALYMGG